MPEAEMTKGREGIKVTIIKIALVEFSFPYVHKLQITPVIIAGTKRGKIKIEHVLDIDGFVPDVWASRLHPLIIVYTPCTIHGKIPSTEAASTKAVKVLACC